MINNNWLPEEIELLRTEWLKGTSAGQLTKLLNRSRCEIIGRVHRMGLGRPDDARREIRKEAARKGVAIRRAAFRRTPAGTFARKIWLAPNSQPRKFKNINPKLHCSYVTGEVRGFETPMCGEPIHRGAYCGFHDQLTHMKRGVLRDAPRGSGEGLSCTLPLPPSPPQNAPPGASGSGPVTTPRSAGPLPISSAEEAA